MANYKWNPATGAYVEENPVGPMPDARKTSEQMNPAIAPLKPSTSVTATTETANV